MKVKIKYISLCSFFLLFFLIQVNTPGYSKSAGLEANSLRVTIDNKKYVFTGNTRVGIKNLRNERVRLTIGLEDRKEKVELFISIDCHRGDLFNETRFTTKYNSITMVFKSKNVNFLMNSPVRLIPESDNGISYVEKGVKGRKGSGKKVKPRWKGMKRSERLASGHGVVRNRKMEGTSLFVTIKPVIENGRIIRFGGFFSGVTKPAKYTFGRKSGIGSLILIKNGEFSVEVKK
jgi:hypothetical protein